MGFGDIMSGVGSIISAGIGLNEAFNEGSVSNRQAQQALDDSRAIAENNLNFQKDNLAYQKELQQQIFNREDTSYQRTANDMQAAGLNPLMMNGTNGAGAAINTQALQQSESPAEMKMQKSQLALQATTQVMNTLKDMSNTMQGIEQSSIARKQLSESQLTELDRLYRSLDKCEPNSQQYKDINAQISKIVLPDSVSALVAMVAKACGLDYSDIAQSITDFFKPNSNNGAFDGQDVVDWLATPIGGNGSVQSSSTLPSSLAEVTSDTLKSVHSDSSDIAKKSASMPSDMKTALQSPGVTKTDNFKVYSASDLKDLVGPTYASKYDSLPKYTKDLVDDILSDRSISSGDKCNDIKNIINNYISNKLKGN